MFFRPWFMNYSAHFISAEEKARLGEVTNLPQFRPLDIGPIGYTGHSQDNNFLPPNISLTRFQVTRGLFGTLFNIMEQKH